jgi:predicted dehydrogenase
MARLHAPSFKATAGVQVVGGVDLDAARVISFCESHRIPRYFTSLEESIEWGEFNAAAKVTPDVVHYPRTDRRTDD